jgi:FkbM family methyltransferase
MSDVTKWRVPLPGHPVADARHGPGWTDLTLRDGTDDVNVLNEIWVQDVYHMRGTDLTDGIVIDLGAHVGVFSLLALQLGARLVHAVEPNDENASLLTQNTFSADRRIRIWHAAASNALDVRLHGSGATGHTTNEEPGAGQGRALPIVSLATLLGLAIDPIRLLKCDIEGAEYDLICGTIPEQLIGIDQIVMEWHGPSETPWVERPRIGELVEHLQHTHSCSIIGRPEAGGYLYAHRA